MKKDYIVFIDSGIGGLSTLASCIKYNKNNYLYVADNKNIPYGSHSEKDIQLFLAEIIIKLKKFYNFKIVVLACNTATTTSIEYLRARFQDLLFIGTEPAIKLAYKNSRKNILAITTPATARQQKFIELKNSLNCNIEVLTINNLAKNIEEYVLNKSFFSYAKLLKNIFYIIEQSKKFDCLVLGCTHYVFLKPYLKKFTNIALLDGNEGVQKQLQKIIYKSNIKQNDNFCIKFYNTLNLKSLKENYKKILSQILANEKLL